MRKQEISRHSVFRDINPSRRKSHQTTCTLFEMFTIHRPGVSSSFKTHPSHNKTWIWIPHRSNYLTLASPFLLAYPFTNPISDDMPPGRQSVSDVGARGHCFWFPPTFGSDVVWPCGVGAELTRRLRLFSASALSFCSNLWCLIKMVNKRFSSI